MKINTLINVSVLPLVLASTLSSAQSLNVEISNLTQGMYFTPLLVSAHDSNQHLFQTGSAASTALTAMAEGGDLSALVMATEALGAINSENPAGGLLGPSSTTMVADFDTGTNSYLSITGMMLPTNDGFVGLDAWPIPAEVGIYTLFLNAYDAGSEVNDERVVDGSGAAGMLGIPANPGGNGGTSGTGVAVTEPNTNIHIHRGNIGDTDTTGGHSDVDSRIHRWLNPVAKVVVTVK